MTNPETPPPPATDFSIAYWCVDCPETFLHEVEANRHTIATGHRQSWRPSGSYAARQKCAHCGRPRVAANHLPENHRDGSHVFETVEALAARLSAKGTP